MAEATTNKNGKKEEKKKALMPLANRLGLDEGATANAPTPAPTPPPLPAAQMGGLVEQAMQKRREDMEKTGGGVLNTNRSLNRVARLGGYKK